VGMFDDLIPGQGGGFDDPVPAKRADPKIGQPEELTFAEKLVSGVKLPAWIENLRGTAPVRALQGAADPMIGAMQTVANVLPDSTGIPQAVNKKVADLERDYQSQRKARGSEGTDVARFAGNVLSPVNAIGGEFLGPATSLMGRAGQGALVGGASAATAPVADTSNGFWGTRAAQIGTGVTTGAILTPVLGKVAEVAARKLNIGSADSVRASIHDLGVEQALAEALKETGQSASDVSPDQMAALRQQVSTALAKGQVMDPAAALRKGDFEALGLDPTLGQITRDPMQFARERNLRGIEGVGDPLLARFYDQEVRLRTKLPQDAARNPYQAGGQLIDSLGKTDEVLRKHVAGLYGEARASAGKDLDVPLQGLAQDYADILHRYGDKVPSGVRNVLGDYGIDPQRVGNQAKVFNFGEADKVLKAINANQSNDPATNAALSELRGALRNTLQAVDTSGGPFAPAVKAASGRFSLQDAVPALKAASEGSVAPDDFVRKFIINGKTDEVKGLAQVLQQADPAAHQEAKAQLADELRRAAFGENMTGDAPFSPARYMAKVRQLGPDKLGAFFSPDEVQDILRVGRVGAYIKQAPNSAPVSTSNSNVGVVNYLAQLPGIRSVAAIANNVVRPVQNRSAVSNALAAEVPSSAAPLTPGQQNWLAYLMAGGAGGAGLFAGSQVGR
jgi:hypothetical protein